MTEQHPARHVVFAHGKESGPWGTKITTLAEVAKRRGHAVTSPDYSFTHDPQARVRHLLALAPSASKSLVLVGSSMGGYVSAMGCAALRPTGLFLMAPALYFQGWDKEPEAVPALCTVVHGWRDDIVPPARSHRFAARHRAALHLLDSDHMLNDQLPMLSQLFDELLARVERATP
jgi:alpha/beta superfamily hydrolase